jgi:hypothetical protein
MKEEGESMAIEKPLRPDEASSLLESEVNRQDRNLAVTSEGERLLSADKRKQSATRTIDMPPRDWIALRALHGADTESPWTIRFVPRTLKAPQGFIYRLELSHPELIAVYTRPTSFSGEPREWKQWKKNNYHAFNVIQYLKCNYVTPDGEPGYMDAQIIRERFRSLKGMGVQPATIRDVVLVSPSSNSYTGMQAVAFMERKNGHILVGEISPPGRDIITTQIDPGGRYGLAYFANNPEQGREELWIVQDTRAIWQFGFNTYIAETGRCIFESSGFDTTYEQFQTRIAQGTVKPYSLDHFPARQGDFVLMDAVAESIAQASSPVAARQEAEKYFVRAIEIVKPGGVFSFVAMEQSGGWGDDIPNALANQEADKQFSAASMVHADYKKLFEERIGGITDVLVIHIPGGVGATSTGATLLQGRRSLDQEVALR